MKKFLAMIMALAMILSLANTAFAYTIQINSKITGHTYEAYQIFKGDEDDNSFADNDKVPNTNAKLTNIQWGKNVQQPVGVDFTAEELAQEVNTRGTQYLINLIKEGKIVLIGPAEESEFLAENNMYVIEDLPAGYYLIKDKASSDPSIVYTEYILEVLEDSTVNPKGTVPKIEKKIKDINDSTDLKKSDWQDSADYDVNDIIPYKLEATLADNLENYENGYNLKFHDYLSEGLTYLAITSVKIINSETDVITLSAADYIPAYEETVADIPETELEEHSKLTVTINGIKAKGGKNGCKVVVEYNAQLNENAVVGSAGNPNEVYLEFSRNPYEENDYGKTPRDRVIAFTYKVIVNKVREDSIDPTTKKPVYAPLPGATFKLEKFYKTAEGTDAEGKPVGEWRTLQTAETNPNTMFTFSGLDDGWYRLTETKAPNGYNGIEPIYFKVSATHDEKSDDPELKMLTATEVKDTGVDLGEGDLGTFEIVHKPELEALVTDVVNRAGVQLPETGGIGTTIFYAAGALMVLFAVILLITKKRMNVAE